MIETRKTITYAVVALLLAMSALLTSPAKVTPDAFLDQGESFYPDFTDPNEATTLEVIEFDEATAAARPFKVTFRKGIWTIPSHHNYPADGADRLAATAAGLIDVRKDDFRSNNVADHEPLGVIDPLDETITSLQGRGKRITVKGASDQVLADLIIGDQVGTRENLRFVRVPGQKRVYVARLDIDISTGFEDWIERDLLGLEKDRIQQIILKDYSINERTGTVNQRDVLILDRSEDSWRANRMGASQEVNTTAMNDLLRSVDELSLAGVRPKPAGLSQNLRLVEGSTPISQADRLSLGSKGYYFTRDGSLLSNEGELEVVTSSGVRYTLRFGELVYGSGEAVTAGIEAGDEERKESGENRYLFVTSAFDANRLSQPRQPRNQEFENKPEEEWTDQDRDNKEAQDRYDEWKRAMEQGQERSEELNARFADWYYVISAESFNKIRLRRSDLIQKKED